MANDKKTPEPTLPVAYNDFYKINAQGSFVMYTSGPSMTRQEFAEECDINTIMRRYEQAGTSINNLPANLPPMYIDFGEMPQTLMEYMEFMKNAETAFMTLPAGVRKEMENDPVQFVEFASDPSNLGRMREWGLAPPAKPQEAPEAAPAPPAKGEPEAPPRGP